MPINEARQFDGETAYVRSAESSIRDKLLATLGSVLFKTSANARLPKK